MQIHLLRKLQKGKENDRSPLSFPLGVAGFISERKAAAVCYRFLTDPYLHRIEVNLLDSAPSASVPSVGRLVGEGIFAKSFGEIYGDVPDYEAFEQDFLSYNAQCTCIAAFDVYDVHRVSLVSSENTLLLSCFQEADIMKTKELAVRLLLDD